MNYLLEMPRFKMRLKSAPQKLLARLSITALVKYCKLETLSQSSCNSLIIQKTT